MVFRPFVSIRGYPCSMYSDRGPQFVSAEKEIRQMFGELDLSNIHRLVETKHCWVGSVSSVVIVNRGGDYLCFVFNGTSLLYNNLVPIACNMYLFVYFYVYFIHVLDSLLCDHYGAPGHPSHLTDGMPAVREQLRERGIPAEGVGIILAS